MSTAPHILARYGFVRPGSDRVLELFASADIAQAPSTLGDGLYDFQQYMQDPAFAQKWQPIAQQLASEGITDLNAVQAAQADFADAYTQMTSASGLDITDTQAALTAAQQYVTVGHTVAGAVQTVQGLVAQAEGAKDVQSSAQFVGSLFGTVLSAATAAGAVTAGVGAAVMAVIGVTLAIIQESLGATAPPKGQQICPGLYCDGAAFTIGCMCVFAQTNAQQTVAVGPGSPNWRHFPDTTNPVDAAWFQVTDPTGGASGGVFGSGSSPYGPGVGNWGGATWNSAAGMRPIDAAFPPYHQLECDQANPYGLEIEPVPPALLDFNKAFFSAWKANAELALNGLRPATDAQVLIQTLRLWNRAHDAGDGIALTADTSGAQLAPPTIATSLGIVNSACPATPYVPYLRMIVNDAINQNPRDLLNANSQLVLHTGAAKSSAIVGAGAGTPSAAASSSSSSGAAAGVVVLGTAAVGTAGWLALGRPMTVSALKAAWRAFWSRR